MKNYVRKGCKVFVIHVMNDEHMNKEDNLKFSDMPILKEFLDVFSDEILGLPLKRELDFTIELVPGMVPNSKAPFHMNIIELNGLKLQLQEIIDKNYIRPSVSPLEGPVLFVKRKMVPYAYVQIIVS